MLQYEERPAQSSHRGKQRAVRAPSDGRDAALVAFELRHHRPTAQLPHDLGGQQEEAQVGASKEVRSYGACWARWKDHRALQSYAARARLIPYRGWHGSTLSHRQKGTVGREGKLWTQGKGQAQGKGGGGQQHRSSASITTQPKGRAYN